MRSGKDKRNPTDDTEHSGGGDANAFTDAAPGFTGSELDPRSPESICWQALKRSALRSCLKLAESTSRGRSAEELSRHLLPLAQTVWQRAFGGRAEIDVPVAPLPVGVLLDTLRRELLEELALVGERLHASHTIDLMRALDAVSEHLDSDPAHRFVSRFLGAAGLEALVEVAHDMRSPLASIVLLVETMRQGQSGPVTEIQERQLALVYGAAFGLSLLANDVIELARGEDRNVDAKRIPFSVLDVIQSVCEIVQPIAEEKRLELRVVPPEADWRQGHPTALHRVLLNLTTNALKFTESGFVELAARQLSRTAIEFSVRDTGRGVPDHLMGTLFDAFREREGSEGTIFSSSGLGLSICRKLVRGMGGELRVENLPTGGLRFCFAVELPLASRF